MKRLCAALTTLLLSCGADTPENLLELPDFGTSHVLFGTAARGRSITPSSLQVMALDAETALSPEAIGGTEIDMVVAGLDASSLPQGLSASDLVFISARNDNARALPELLEPHLLQRPSPAEAPGPLVPVSADGLSRDIREEREARLQSMLEGVALQSPCAELPSPVRVTAPRTSADVIRVMRTLSNGDTIVGFTITSTVVFARIPSGSTELETITIPVPQDILLPGEISEMRWVSDREVQVGPNVLPDALSFDISNGFGSIGVHLEWDETQQRYVEDTPTTPEVSPRTLHGVAQLDLDGAAHVCGFGSGLGSTRPAVIWCRTTTSTTWAVQLEATKAFGVSAIYPRPDGRHIATDLAGTIYEYAGNARWAPVLQSSLNSGCDPLCASFSVSRALSAPSTPVLIAGAKAQLLLVQAGAQGLNTQRPPALDPALFSTELPEGSAPLRFTAAAEGPDGALWIADASPTLLRLNPERTQVERICLPKEMTDVPIAAIEAHPDGRLLLGMSPALLGVGRWSP